VSIFAALFACANGALSHDDLRKSVALMTSDERQAMVADLQARIDEYTKTKRFFEDDPSPVNVKVSLDEPGNYIVLDLGERLGPRAYEAEAEDMTDLLFNRVWPYLERIDGPTGVRFLYGGHEPEHWPENRYPESISPSSRRRKRDIGAAPLVVVSPGHGVYYHGRYKDWRAQREAKNGVLEDDVTPQIAGHLVSALQRDVVTADVMRPESWPLAHEPSKEPWWRLAARYQLELRYPDLASVWRSEPQNEGDAMQHRKEDIRSRPLYANHVGADAILHIHTNADDDASVNGLRTYIVERSEDRALATAILCSAKELIHTDEKFSGFGVAPRPHVNPNHAENRRANMPSVIVEVGFHTNATDASFLLDRTFQALAMRGVAKGYRLYRNNLPCGDFAVSPFDDVNGRVGVDVHVPLTLKGNPRFPITIWSKDVTCTGRGCHNKDKMLFSTKELDKFKVQYLCRREDVERSPVTLSVTARDADGVRAVPATLKVACMAG
jgi:N-acetylmuramoyl-L-alanine amidase